MTSARVLIIKTGSSISEACARFGDFEDWFMQSMGTGRFDFDTRAVFQGTSLPADPAGLHGVVVTGSPAMVSHRHDWSERTAEWLAGAHAAGVPMLGVCYGHQLLAHALGGTVGPNPAGRLMGTSTVRITAGDDELLGPFAPEATFQTTHLEAVLEPPAGARVLAEADHDPNHALYFGNATWGVQFHPEFDDDIMDCYIRARREMLVGEGHDPDHLLSGLAPTPSGNALMRRFAEMVEARIPAPAHEAPA